MAINVVKLVESMLENCDRFTKNHCMNVFKGSNLKDIKDKGHDKLPLYGIGRKLERDRIERLFDHLELYEVLKQQAFQNQTGWNTLYIQVTKFAFPSLDNCIDCILSWVRCRMN